LTLYFDQEQVLLKSKNHGTPTVVRAAAMTELRRRNFVFNEPHCLSGTNRRGKYVSWRVVPLVGATHPT
jgi:hypothetical protein